MTGIANNQASEKREERVRGRRQFTLVQSTKERAVSMARHIGNELASTESQKVCYVTE